MNCPCVCAYMCVHVCICIYMFLERFWSVYLQLCAFGCVILFLMSNSVSLFASCLCERLGLTWDDFHYYKYNNYYYYIYKAHWSHHTQKHSSRHAITNNKENNDVHTQNYTFTDLDRQLHMRAHTNTHVQLESWPICSLWQTRYKQITIQ